MDKKLTKQVTDAAALLKLGASEIENLRTINQRMGEKLWLVESMLELSSPRRSGGGHPDVAFEMYGCAEELTSSIKGG